LVSYSKKKNELKRFVHGKVGIPNPKRKREKEKEKEKKKEKDLTNGPRNTPDTIQIFDFASCS